MPKKGFKSITIREAAYKKLLEIAEKLGMSLPEAVAYIVQTCEIKAPVVSQNAPQNQS